MAYKKLIILLLPAFMPIIGSAVVRDPTTPSYPVQTESSTTSHNDELILSAIWISAKSRRATLNGVSARQGETILNGIKVMQIRHNSITIKQNGVIKTVQLVQRPYKKTGK